MSQNWQCNQGLLGHSVFWIQQEATTAITSWTDASLEREAIWPRIKHDVSLGDNTCILMASDGSCCSRSVRCGLCPLEYRPLLEVGSRVDSDGGWQAAGCCSRSMGHGLRLLEYRPRQEAGSRVDSDGSCCSRSIGYGLRPLEYRPCRRQEVVWTRTEAASLLLALGQMLSTSS